MSTSASSASYNNLLRAVASQLLAEVGHSLAHLGHASSSEIRDLVRHLLVIRPPPDSSSDRQQEEELYSRMDALLALERTRHRSLVDASQLPAVASQDAPGFDQIVLWRGDITTLKATAIVNAANPTLLGCFQPSHHCIDNVIHNKAGPRLRAACSEIMSRQGHEEPAGSAHITPDFCLPATYVLHTVGPQLRGSSECSAVECDQLRACYVSSLNVLLKTVGSQKTCVTVAFPCISTGLYGFPNDVAVSLAVDTVVEWLSEHRAESAGWKIVFNTLLKRDYDLYRRYIKGSCPGNVSIPTVTVASSTASALQAIQEADYLLVAAGAGLSAAAGLDYGSEELMKQLHPQFLEIMPKFRTMVCEMGRPEWDPPLMWGYLFKNVSIIRYDWVRYRTAPTYDYVKAIVNAFENRQRGSSYIKTSNGDGMFEQEAFDMASVYLMQGDYSLLQCTKPCSESVWDTKPFMEKALKSFNPETYRIEDPAGIPRCPKCGGPMFFVLRADASFLQSAVDGMRYAYEKWLTRVVHDVETNGKKLVILEVGAGFNTPVVIRIPDERLARTDGVTLVRVNPQHPDMPYQCHGVGVAEDANAVLGYIAQQVSSPSSC